MNITGNHVSIVLLICVTAFFSIKSCNESKNSDVLEQQANLYKAKNDTLISAYNSKTGELEYSKQAYAAEIGTLTDFLAKNEAKLAQLQKDNKGAKFGISATTTMKIDTTVRNQPSSKTDTCNDTRTATINAKYYDADIISKPNTTSLDLRVKPDSVSYVLDKNNRLKVIHSNRLFEVVELNSFYVNPPAQKKKNWKYWVGGIIGAGVVYGVTH